MVLTLGAEAKLEYERHDPERSILYQTIKQYWPSFVARCDGQDQPVPAFVKREVDGFLRCGVLANGFARVYCQECKYDRLVPFSCKKRGFCSSCMSRRMSETAVRLSDFVIPKIPTRQWVLSLPSPLRYLVAYDNDALSFIVTAFISTLFSYLRKRAKRSGGAVLDAESYSPGAVTFIQRFGSALNLNVHLHSQVSDGAYIKYGDGKTKFIRVGDPSPAEIRQIAIKIAKRVHRYLESRMENGGDGLSLNEPLLASCYEASIRYVSASGDNAGKPLVRLISTDQIKENSYEENTVMGFNLHASKAIGSEDRESLEHILRYMGRPPLSSERLNMAPDGSNLILTLKSAWRNGTSKILLSPFDLIERLIALIPYPRKNQVRYHGFLAPNSDLRKKIVDRRDNCSYSGGAKIYRPLFAELMSRVFDIDILECPRCYSRMQLISYIHDNKTTKKILESLKMSTAPPPVYRPEEYRVNYEIEAHPIQDEYWDNP
jgi:hypothetical protein